MKVAPIAKAALLLLVLCRQAAAEDRVFFGNLHSHTSYSDGSGKPADAYTYARTKGKLDFLLISEHNHASAENGASADRRDGILIAKDHSLYTGPKAAALIPAAKSATKANFLALYGQEFSTISSGNHVNVFDVPKVIDAPNGDFKDLVRWLGENKDSGGQPAIVQLNHPAEYNEADNEEYGRDDFASATEWLAQFGGHVSLAELVVGPAMAKPTDTDKTPRVMEKDYLDLLNIGFKVAPTADQDNHYKTWGTSSNARTGVVADALTKEKILAALRARHAYATEDPTLRIVVRMGRWARGRRGRLAGPELGDPDRHLDRRRRRAGRRLRGRGLFGQGPRRRRRQGHRYCEDSRQHGDASEDRGHPLHGHPRPVRLPQDPAARGLPPERRMHRREAHQAGEQAHG